MMGEEESTLILKANQVMVLCDKAKRSRDDVCRQTDFFLPFFVV
jgi:hypothetical protein